MRVFYYALSSQRRQRNSFVFEIEVPPFGGVVPTLPDEWNTSIIKSYIEDVILNNETIRFIGLCPPTTYGRGIQAKSTSIVIE
jgi:hypothetical protein